MNNQQWKKVYKDLPLCTVEISNNGNDTILVISGSLKGKLFLLSATKHLQLEYKASASSTLTHSFAGDGLPYPSEMVAFEKSSNCGKVDIVDGKFLFSIEYPNSYMRNGGREYISPEVQVRVVDFNTNVPLSNWQAIYLGEGIPFRHLRHPRGHGPHFYDRSNLPPARSQFQILMDSAYPKHSDREPNNFWGFTPPH